MEGSGKMKRNESSTTPSTSPGATRERCPGARQPYHPVGGGGRARCFCPDQEMLVIVP